MGMHEKREVENSSVFLPRGIGHVWCDPEAGANMSVAVMFPKWFMVNQDGEMVRCCNGFVYPEKQGYMIDVLEKLGLA